MEPRKDIIDPRKDILTLFEQLNSHEVFTPPRVARSMLNLLPNEIWSDPNIRILDPCVKSGVFLREAMYLLIDGLAGKGMHKGYDGVTYDLNDGKQRMNHILKNMLFGIATSELTSYVSRRTLYGVMEANTDKQTAILDAFQQSKNNGEWTDDETAEFKDRNRVNGYYDHSLFNTLDYAGFEHEGNIFYPRDEVQRQVDESDSFEIEDIYYPFIEEQVKHRKIKFIKDGKMKFNVIIGNPPYQISIGNTSGNKSKAKAIYHKFIEHAIKMNPNYISMITPSRWMTKSTEGIKEAWVDNMISDKRMRELHDFPDPKSCFPNVDIKGGVSYFLWDSQYIGNCRFFTYVGDSVQSRDTLLDKFNIGFVIRDFESESILEKVFSKMNDLDDESFSKIVSPKDFFTNKTLLTSSWTGFSKDKCEQKNIKYFLNKNMHKIDNGWISYELVPKNRGTIKQNKVFIPAAGGTGSDKNILGRPILGSELSACSQTYLVIGYDPEKPFSRDECLNIISYIKTKFFRYLVSIKKKTQNGARGVYKLVPIQNFRETWDDKKLYKKYSLSEDEISIIEQSIASMD
jgi:hypothetical protein